MPAISPLFQSQFPGDIKQIVELAKLPDLAGRRVNPSLSSQITAWAQANRPANSSNTHSSEKVDLILAGLWLLEGDLDASHELSQKWETPTGSYWHAIMHRREGDFGNSKYWYRRIKKHPAAHHFQELLQSETVYSEHTQELANKKDLMPFLESWVDLNQKATRNNTNPKLVSAVSELAWLEWQIVMHHTLS
jgi:hypothetical protein